MNISLVAPGNVAALVPQLLPYLRESALWSRGRAGVDDILRFVLNGQMQLWVVHVEHHALGHVVTEVKQYPASKMLTVQYCAMTPGTLAQVEDDLQQLAERVARDAGCAGIEFIGRPGWRHTARKYGYTVESVSYQKFFEVQR